ncbi:MAG: hypothetical protein LBB38_01065, partial [Puniceicoccales bacterium]|nr:hypothetical protein [Puniceicoccales bacterium]
MNSALCLSSDVAVANAIAMLPHEKQLAVVLSGQCLSLLSANPYCAKFRLFGCGNATALLRTIISAIRREFTSCGTDYPRLEHFQLSFCSAFRPLLAGSNCEWIVPSLIGLLDSANLAVDEIRDLRGELVRRSGEIAAQSHAVESIMAREFDGLPAIRSFASQYQLGAFPCEIISHEGQRQLILEEFCKLSKEYKLRYMRSTTCVYFALFVAPQFLQMENAGVISLRAYRESFLCAYFSMPSADLLAIDGKTLVAKFLGKTSSSAHSKRVVSAIVELLDGGGRDHAVELVTDLFTQICLWWSTSIDEKLQRIIALTCLAFYRFHVKGLADYKFLELLRTIFTRGIEVPYDAELERVPEHCFLLPGNIPLQMRLLAAALVPQWSDFVIPNMAAIDAAPFSPGEFAVAIEIMLRTAFPSVIGFEFPSQRAIASFAEDNYPRLLSGELQCFLYNYVVNGPQARLFLLLFRAFFTEQNRICCFLENGSFLKPLFLNGEIH